MDCNLPLCWERFIELSYLKLSQGAAQLEEQSSHKELALTGIPGRNISYPLSVNPHVKDSLGKGQVKEVWHRIRPLKA